MGLSKLERRSLVVAVDHSLALIIAYGNVIAYNESGWKFARRASVEYARETT